MSFIKNILYCLNYNTYWFSIISCLKVAGYILILIENKEQNKKKHIIRLFNSYSKLIVKL